MNREESALLLAIRVHKHQLYGIFPYEYHLLMVRDIAKELGLPPEVVVSCILHDILEDTSISYSDIKKQYGTEIAEIVYHVTDELGRNRLERKEKTYSKIIKLDKAILVKLCDRIANVRFSRNEGGRDKHKMYMKERKEFYREVISERIFHNQLIKDVNEVLEREYAHSNNKND